MTPGNLPGLKGLILRLGYHENSIKEILSEIDALLKEIDFEKIKHAAHSAIDAKDNPALISSLKDLMLSLENKGFYRPDAPTKLIRLLVNGSNLANEDIFALIEKANIAEEEKRKEQEFLASCAAITQLGYILSSCLVPEVKAASSGPHVFLIIDIYPGREIFVDFSIDSIMEVNLERFDRKENYYSLKITDRLDTETIERLKTYYSFFQITSGIGLSHNIHNNLGIAYDKIGKYEQALEELRCALRLNPDYIEVRNNLAVTYNKLGRQEEAVKELEEALRLNPGYAEAHSNLGTLHAGAGRLEEAVEEIKIAIKLNPCSALAHNNLGNIYAMQNRPEDAIAEFKEALRLNPDYAQARNGLGNIYSESGMFDEALGEFQEALRIEPDSAEAYHGIGSAYYNLGSLDRAAQAWARAVYFDHELIEFVPEKLLLKVKQGVSRLR